MNLRKILSAAAFTGLAALVFGSWAEPGKAHPTLLIAGLFALTLSLGAGVFLAIQDVTGAVWSGVLRPAAAAMTRCYWPAALLVLAAILSGGGEFFGWAQGSHGAHGPAPEPQGMWLAPYALYLRTVFYLAAWGGLLGLIRRGSFSAGFLVVFGVTLSLAAFDWLMALEPGWSSTMFGVYIFAGLFLGTLAALVAGTTALSRTGQAAPIGDSQLHDLGKLIFGFSMFWAYIWYCQYMLIWYANNPEEISFFLRRHTGGWAVLSLTSVGLNWLAPFCVLLPQWTKRREAVLFRVSLVVLAGHWLDLYILVMPRFAGPAPSFAVWEGLVFLGTLAAFGILFLYKYGRPQGTAG